MVQEVDDFFGVYLLYCLNPRFKGRTYIGYTVNPERRIKQHNTGAHAGGAYRTSGKGPWEMALIIHGFPNEISGLRFEWAWQNPHKSRRLKAVVPSKVKTELAFDYRWRVACHMLRTNPWAKLGLTIRWLRQDYQRNFPQGLDPPYHMPIEYGPVTTKKVSSDSRGKGKAPTPRVSTRGNANVSFSKSEMCALCRTSVEKSEKSLTCLHPSCSMISHLRCLARHFLGNSDLLLPVEGRCPTCDIGLVWGDLIRHMKGCHQNLTEVEVIPD